MLFKRVITIVIDGLGVGKDSLQECEGDKGANTLASVYGSGLCNIPTLERLGILLLKDNKRNTRYGLPKAYVSAIESASIAKDTVTGH